MQIFGFNITTGKPQAVRVSDDGELLTSVGGASGGSAVPVEEQLAPAYEDGVAGKAVTEERYTTSRITTTGTILSGVGYIKGFQVQATTASPTAGTLTIYDNTSAAGTIIWAGWVTGSTQFIPLNRVVTTGIHAVYTTLANVAVHTQYR